MSKTTDFAKALEKHNKSLYSNHTYHAETRHIHFDEKAVVFPKGVTQESLNAHSRFVNELTAAVEDTTAKVARQEYEKDNKIQFVDGTLTLGDITINAHHTIWDDIADEKHYGVSHSGNTHIINDHEHISAMRDKNKELAKTLFEKHSEKKD